MRVLILGGTRFMGPRVVAELVEAGHAVTVFHRGKTQAKLPRGVTEIIGDRWEMGESAAALKRTAPEIVVDMLPLTERDAQAVMRLFSGIARRIVSISSADVYRAYGRLHGTEPGIPELVPQNEDSPLREKLYPYRGETRRGDDDPRKFLDDYDKILVERVMTSDPNLPGTVLRLPMVYGPWDYQHRLYEYVKRMDDKRPIILLDEGTAQWRTTRGYVDDIAHGIAVAVLDERACNRIYNVCEVNAFSTQEWIGAIAGIVQWKGEVVIAPKNLVPKTLVVENSQHHLVTDSSRIRRELGYAELVAPDVALARTIEWERAHPPENIDPKRFDYAVEDAAFKEFERLQNA